MAVHFNSVANNAVGNNNAGNLQPLHLLQVGQFNDARLQELARNLHNLQKVHDLQPLPRLPGLQQLNLDQFDPINAPGLAALANLQRLNLQ